MPVRILHVYQPVLYGFVYSIFTAIYFAADSTITPIYAFLDFRKKPGLAIGLEVFVVLLLIPAVHFLFWTLYKLRVCIWQKTNHDRWHEKSMHSSKPAGQHPIFVFTVQDENYIGP